MRNSVLITFLLTIAVICNAQSKETLVKERQENKGFDVGLDFSISEEPRIENYNTPAFNIDRALHFDYLPNVTYNFNNSSALGLLIGFGHGTSENYNGFFEQTEYFKSNSSEIGLFYKYRLISLFNHRLSGFIQPIFRYRKVNQVTEIHEENGQSGEFMTGGQDIKSMDLNLRLTMNYVIVRRFDVGFFVSNDIISKEQVKEKAAFMQPSNEWIFIKDYIFGGLTLTYKLN